MNIIEVTLAGIRQFIQKHDLERYTMIGWERVATSEEQPQALKPEETPKKKTARARKTK